MKTKAKPKERYDAVQMVREIRDAHYRQDTDPDFDPAELKRIKAKWTKLLDEQLKAKMSSSRPSEDGGRMSKPSIMKQLRDIREKVSLEIVGMDLEELQAYLKAKGSITTKKAAARKPRVRAVART